MREVNFADGFVSATAPTSSGIGQEEYPIENDIQVFIPVEDEEGNQFIFNEVEFTSYSMILEVERFAFEVTKRQQIGLDCVFNGDQWVLSSGLSTGDDIIQLEEADQAQQVALRVNDGVLEYMSGNMIDHLSSKLKFITTKVKA